MAEGISSDLGKCRPQRFADKSKAEVIRMRRRHVQAASNVMQKVKPSPAATVNGKLTWLFELLENHYWIEGERYE